jgi:hypothetical protein
MHASALFRSNRKPPTASQPLAPQPTSGPLYPSPSAATAKWSMVVDLYGRHLPVSFEHTQSFLVW